MTTSTNLTPGTPSPQRPKPRFSSKNCTHCWKCVDACPHKALRPMTFLFHSHPIMLGAKCRRCGVCVASCPNGCFSFRPTPKKQKSS